MNCHAHALLAPLVLGLIPPPGWGSWPVDAAVWWCALGFVLGVVVAWWRRVYLGRKVRRLEAQGRVWQALWRREVKLRAQERAAFDAADAGTTKPLAAGKQPWRKGH